MTTGSGLPPQEPPAAQRPELLYFILVDRFANGSPDNDGDIALDDPHGWHGGDLAGVRNRLDHLEALGVTRVWLSPVFGSRQSKFDGWGAFHGYWVSDFTQVEPRFGTQEELRALADDLHARGMALNLDMVWNHVAWEAPVRSEHPEWFHPDTPIEDWDDPTQSVQGWVHGLPDLAQEHPQVADWLLETSLSWVDAVGADGFRIDAVRHMPPPFIRQMAAALHEAAGPEFRLLGETFTGDPWLLAESRRMTELDAVFDFPLRYALVDAYCHDRSLGRIASVLSLDRYHDDPNRSLVTFLDNHDLPRITHECGGDLDRVRAAIDALLALRGVPMISYGTESALSGGTEPANRDDLPWRAPMPLLDDIQRGVRRRAEHPALADGDLTVLMASDDRILVRRESPDEALCLEITREGVKLLPAQGGPWAGDRREVLVAVTGLPSGHTAGLVGTGPDLGNWKPDPSIPPRPDGLLRFEASSGDVLEYKLIAFGPDGIAWEQGENRYTQVPEGQEPLTLRLNWNAREG